MAYIRAMLRAKSMKVDVSTELNCSAIRAWNEVQKSSLLQHVIWPLARLCIAARNASSIFSIRISF
jgi:hypothetical protein